MWKKVSPGDFVIFLFISRHVKLVCHETSLRHWRLAAASWLTETSHIRNELQCHARRKLLRQATVSTSRADVSKRDVVPTVRFTTRKKSHVTTRRTLKLVPAQRRFLWMKGDPTGLPQRVVNSVLPELKQVFKHLATWALTFCLTAAACTKCYAFLPQRMLAELMFISSFTLTTKYPWPSSVLNLASQSFTLCDLYSYLILFFTSTNIHKIVWSIDGWYYK